MVTVSLCMIVRNEEHTLPRCLDSVRDLVDEIVIVDTGSTDGTVSAAARYTGRVFSFPWADDFSAARNFAFDRGTMDYLMWLDADDGMEEADRALFREEKAALSPDTDVVMLPYRSGVDGEGRAALTYLRERLVRRSADLRWQGAIHEVIPPAGKVAVWRAAVTHRKEGPGDPDRNLRIFEGLLAKGQVLSPREQFYYGRELLFHGRDREAAAALESFLAGGGGWVEDEKQACRDLSGCYERSGDREASFAALTRALRFGPPSPELCCDLGRFHLGEEAWQAAAFWYELALSRPPEEGYGFSSPDCRGYVPALQLCVCRWHLGDRAGAERYNELAASFRPDSEAVRLNRAFFEAQKP